MALEKDRPDSLDPITKAIVQAGTPCLESQADFTAVLESCGISLSKVGEKSAK
ncbi:hypothetical protein DSO57_1030773 [Entomophthora muscae]|uniref:Uncharacterized protein n=1 Tax=Entomophthora muscae TaxID=34485 RepID=A0ACC2UAN2_9FUNG|nr:hypothetical protein DSO57_1030773 [Entomophthora muscae]